MIDIRSHILDGTPCGPDSPADSLEMCRAAAADGVRTLVATPRWEAGRAEPPLPFDECSRKLRRLESETGGRLSLKLGFALQFSPDLPALVGRYGSELALAGKRHLLVSLPSVEVPPEAEGVWGALSRAGFSVVLSHPECNTVLRRDAARLARWVSEGLTLQVDAASVAGTHGREVRRFALECLRKYEGHAAVASNARWDGGPRCSLGDAREELSAKVGARQARCFTKETPAALIGDADEHHGARGAAPRGLASVLRSFAPIKALTGQS
ncbi:MAG TPA: CpsB/CapC family capsule biosynthesis tyrosine phosphatase [Pyrinomonadaceae bacterium]|jgi:protein-tyrosine phosphatase